MHFLSTSKNRLISRAQFETRKIFKAHNHICFNRDLLLITKRFSKFFESTKFFPIDNSIKAAKIKKTTLFKTQKNALTTERNSLKTRNFSRVNAPLFLRNFPRENANDPRLPREAPSDPRQARARPTRNPSLADLTRHSGQTSK